MEDPAILYDDDGLIVHEGYDGGDTCQREGWYWTGVWVRERVLGVPWLIPRALDFDDVLGLLEPKRDGVFYRHPKLKPWNNPHRKKFGFSRDQMIPVVVAMGLADRKEPIRRLWHALPQDPLGGTKHAFNGSWEKVLGQRAFHTGDIIGPMTRQLFERALRRSAKERVAGGDEELLLNVGIRLAAADRDKADTGDDLNLLLMLLMSRLRDPSDVSEAAIDLYRRRPVSYGSFLGSYRAVYGVDRKVGRSAMIDRMEQGIRAGWVADCSAVLGAIRWYHREETGANPALATLYEPIVAKYFE